MNVALALDDFDQRLKRLERQTTNQTAFLDIIAELAETLEWATREIHRLRGAIESAQSTKEAYLAGVGVRDDDVHLGSIRVLRQRLAAIRRDLPSSQ